MKDARPEVRKRPITLSTQKTAIYITCTLATPRSTKTRTIPSRNVGKGARPVRNLNLPTKRALMPPRLERARGRARALDAKLAEIWDLGGRKAGRQS